MSKFDSTEMGMTIRQEGTNVLLISNGKLVSIMPWQAAIAVSQAILSKAKQAEEIANAANVIHDNAILHRAGVGIGLSSNSKIVEETKKEMISNRDLRRYMPNIKSTEIVHAPVIKHVQRSA